MQNKHTIRDRCILLTLLFIFSIGTYSLFGNIKSVNFYELAGYQHRVKGTVTDANGVPIAGATITIKGTSTGTFTNEEGVFFVSASPPDVLVLTYIGFKPFEVQVGNSDELSIVLQEDVTNLDAVTVNAGYYTVKERERTGSIVKVTSEEIEIQPITSPLQSLEGRMAGVEVEQGSGITGLAPKIQIRGRNSLRNEGNYPLYIINGIPVNSEPLRSAGSFTNSSGIDPLSTLNLSNIESIEILKDADATAIYGSRGSNGVVLITTKKGSGGKTSLTIDMYSGVSIAAQRMKLLNTKQYLSMREQAFEDDGVTPSERNAPDLTLWDQSRYTDWQDLLFGRAATINNINMTLSGGNEYTSYLVGGSYLTQGSVFPGDFDYHKITANFQLNHRSKNNKLQLNFSVNYGVDDNALFLGANFVNQALNTPPNAPTIYKEDGSLNWDNWLGNNPLSVLEIPQDINTENILSNIGLSYNIWKGLKLKTNLGYSLQHNQEVIKFHKESYNPTIQDIITLSSRHSMAKRRSWIIEPQIEYIKNFKDLHIDALVGGSFQSNSRNYLAIEGRGYTERSLMGNIKTADDVRALSHDNIYYRYAAIFGRLGINWSRKYYLNITGRRDGSSRFGPNKRFANFWAVGGAWIFSEDSFIKEAFPFLSFGKVRGSYGTTGSDQIGDYQYLDAYEATDGAGGLYPTALFNADYSWEVNKKLEAALQLGFLKDHINIEISWYRNRSSNQLVGYPLPAITGFTSVQANLPALVQNTGWEMQLATMNIQRQDFSWLTSLNMTFPNNKLVAFKDIDQTSYVNRYRIGYPLNIALLYQYDGIDPETGFYRIADVDQDGMLTNDDRVVIKNRGRKFYGGISNQIKYKKFLFQFLFEFVQQNNDSYIFSAHAPGSFNNKPVEFLNAWERPGDREEIQKISQSSEARNAFNNAANSTMSIDDASFLRLKNLSISYQLPKQVTEKLNIQSMNIFFRAQNLLTITSYKGLDPQGGARVIPPLRTITCGVQVKI